MAYNEETNIGHAIRSVLDQRSGFAEVTELIVVASGCSDRTADVVEALAREEPRVRLICEERRTGKASAINLFLEMASSPILVMVGGDLVLGDGSIDALVRHFSEPAVGMVGGRPIPVNDANSLLGHSVHLLWNLHDLVARESPKLGEFVAFRNVVDRIPLDTAVDEISIEMMFTKLGYRLVYEPAGVLYNCGPATIADFLRCRRRISAGHLRVAKEDGYAASTMSIVRIARALLRLGASKSLRPFSWTAGAIILEILARALGRYDYLRGRRHSVWATARTRKHDVSRALAARDDASSAGASGPNFADLTGAASGEGDAEISWA